MTAKDFILKTYPNTLKSGSVTWQSPSNIALVKYWGKKDNQIPANPSISFTLDACKTTTELKFKKRDLSTEPVLSAVEVLKVTSGFSFDIY